MSEDTDAVVLIVSEETGAISLAYDSKLYYDLSPIEVQRKLRELLDREDREQVAARNESEKDLFLESRQ
jgi:diadenylate cyclase